MFNAFMDRRDKAGLFDLVQYSDRIVKRERHLHKPRRVAFKGCGQSFYDQLGIRVFSVGAPG